ncbi:MmgE/PrpD family protein [Liquorilactobacillus sucicola DSM 21376 = JCM 15457]|uniref:MmgE/PrpD family protein n=1 Tax=Liquorilactobacillus sucicola DSM 21376 = JCM 15457 TaxID=1423806 RepID=A0A023D164_9LACO|nr:MmgE/PrpD family protein [Liquorilactobacillus sucicola]KRN07366.1 hypothetical protein FD15_GL002313 [Liquorilactobacillus sucicola DSM 21376 = JCM 15457]GAJ27510.1 MmgE/PrpD family protein [Liquorilactobacillus sucicola DSM 21376 = JCM 15457]
MTVKNLKIDFQTNTTALVSQLLVGQEKYEQKFEVCAKRALINYLTVLQKSKDEPAVKKINESFDKSQQNFPLNAGQKITAERAAFLNGFAAHYLDLDDTQANLRGHPSAVIMSALFAVTTSKDEIKSFLWAFIQGVETAGKLGKVLNPKLAWRGWHTTGMIGTVAAAAAIGVYKRVNKKQLINTLSFAVTQASGLEVQSGSDGKPFNAGIAARNAVYAFLTAKSGINAEQDPFSNSRGWLKTIADLEIKPEQLIKNWLSPAEIEVPGLWFKTYPFCSAGMSSYDAARSLYAKGIRIDNCQKVIIDFPQEGDHALRYKLPRTGKEGRFSAEYIVWQVLSRGAVTAASFELLQVPQSFTALQTIFQRQHNLVNDSKDARPTEIKIMLKDGTKISKKVIYPEGSPRNEIDTRTLWSNFSKLNTEGSQRLRKLLDDELGKVIELIDM